MKILWIHQLFFLLLWDPVEMQSCDPELDCQSSGAGKKVPDPKDCERYYYCFDNDGQPIPTANSIACTSGMYFDLDKNECALENIKGVCNSNPCACLTECPSDPPELAFVANKNSCSQYTICTSTGTTIETTCPSQTPYFNGQQCVADSSECCDFCMPSCSRPFSQILDPCDCTSFYLCDTNEMITMHSQCDSGEYFDESTGTCKVGPCNDLCSSCGSSPSNTTTTTTTNTATATTSTTTTTTTTTTPDHNCADSFTCPSNWDYPRCTECDPSYWHCTGGVAYLTYCSGTQVFNTDPLYPYCILPANCPFHPSIYV